MAHERKRNSSNFINRTYLEKECVLTNAIEIIGSRWTVQVLYALNFGDDRFSKIKTRLRGISDQSLGTRIKHLQDVRLIQKNTKDNDITYALTARAKRLIKILDALVDWQALK